MARVSTLTGIGSPAFAGTRSSIDGHAHTGKDGHPWDGRGRSQKRMELSYPESWVFLPCEEASTQVPDHSNPWPIEAELFC